jgi:uncharacterized protein (TIGR03066 family)
MGCLAVLVLTGFVSAADEKIDAKKLIGKWEPKDQKKGEDFVLEFVDATKFTVTHTVDGKPMKTEGTYKVDGNKVTIMMTVNGKEVKATHIISKLTDTEMVGTDEKGKEGVLKKVK